MKKNLKILLVVLSVVLLFSSCSGDKKNNDLKDDDKSKQTTIESSKEESDDSNFDNDSEITVISREEGSGTRGAFIEIFEVKVKDKDGNKVDRTIETADISQSTGVVMTSVAGNDKAIGYISLGSLNDTVKGLKVDGEAASKENIKNKKYKIARPFNIATKGDVSKATETFINYILSEEGQIIVEENGYISNGNNGKFAGPSVEGKITINGSSSVSPVMEKLKEAYEKVNPNTEIELNQSDSTNGMNSAIEGIADIGMASRNLKDSELEKGLNNTVIAMDGIAIVVNNNNPLEDIKSEDVKKVYIGEIVKWSELSK